MPAKCKGSQARQGGIPKTPLSSVSKAPTQEPGAPEAQGAEKIDHLLQGKQAAMLCALQGAPEARNSSLQPAARADKRPGTNHVSELGCRPSCPIQAWR